jgi:DNA polymerase IV
LLRWLVLDLNSFFASCEQQEHPELRGKPVIVVPTMAETTCEIAASYLAKGFGIKTGTLVHEARRRCPDVKLVQAHH